MAGYQLSHQLMRVGTEMIPHQLISQDCGVSLTFVTRSNEHHAQVVSLVLMKLNVAEEGLIAFSYISLRVSTQYMHVFLQAAVWSKEASLEDAFKLGKVRGKER